MALISLLVSVVQPLAESVESAHLGLACFARSYQVPLWLFYLYLVLQHSDDLLRGQEALEYRVLFQLLSEFLLLVFFLHFPFQIWDSGRNFFRLEIDPDIIISYDPFSMEHIICPNEFQTNLNVLTFPDFSLLCRASESVVTLPMVPPSPSNSSVVVLPSELTFKNIQNFPNLNMRFHSSLNTHLRLQIEPVTIELDFLGQ